MKISRVLIVYKKSTLQIQGLEHKEPRFLELLDAGHEVVTRVKTAHAEHYETLTFVQEELAGRGIEFESYARSELKRKTIEDFDLVISVGGDGTFLDASHFLHSVPLLGVNSAISSSFGHFCLANENSFNKVLDEIAQDKIQPERLMRLELELKGRVLPELVLNEVLICHSNPAGTSRFWIEIGDAKEEQRSSGIWIGPPSGSTGALRAAGGKILPITGRQYQYIVREPLPRPNEDWKLERGLIDEAQSMRIVSEVRTGSLFIDGAHIFYPFPLGEELLIRVSPYDLNAYVLPNVNDIFAGKKK